MESLKVVNFVIMMLFVLCYSYQFVYMVIPFFKKEKSEAEIKQHRFAVLISARNESAVIANLIESVKAQNYPGELVDIFVVADNCTDDTAQIARAAGATVWERFNKHLVGKGYALDYLLKRIKENYPKGHHNGFFVIDADNILDESFITEMNKEFSRGSRIITSYRNSKNYESSWVSAGHSLWFIRESKFMNYSRMLLGTSSVVSGTGFLIHSDIVEENGGWPFHMLSEDTEFTASSILKGEKIAFCVNAVVFDEQPVQLRQSWTQRMRWARGYLQVFGKYGLKLSSGMFRKNGFSCFDIIMSILPAIILAFVTVIVGAAALVTGLMSGAGFDILFGTALESLAGTYATFFLMGAVTTISEWHSIHASRGKKIAYMFTFPIYMFTYIPVSICSIFSKVEWKPIRHCQSKTLAQIKGRI